MAEDERKFDSACAVGITDALVQCATINCQLHGMNAHAMIGIASAALAQLCFRQTELTTDAVTLRRLYLEICERAFDTQAPIMLAWRQEMAMAARATTTEVGHG